MSQGPVDGCGSCQRKDKLRELVKEKPRFNGKLTTFIQNMFIQSSVK